MKKLIIVLLLAFGLSCAGKMAKPKCEVPPPPPAPTQEELLAQAVAQKTEQEFDVFWEEERHPLAFYMTSQIGAPTEVVRKEVIFTSDYRVALVHAKLLVIAMDVDVEMMNLYIVMTRPDGVWQVAQIIAEITDEAQQIIDERQQGE